MDDIDECFNVPNYDSFPLHPSDSIHHSKGLDSHDKIIINSCAHDSHHAFSDVGAHHHADNPRQLHVGGDPAVPGQRLD